nr:MAG TPA: hypothetical protein [Caudoviricetes sp.]
MRLTHGSLPMMDLYYNTKRALSQIALFGGRDGTRSIKFHRATCT